VFEKFSDAAKRVLEFASGEARESGESIGSQHILLGVYRADGSMAARILRDDYRLTSEMILSEIKKITKAHQQQSATDASPFTSHALEVIDFAGSAAARQVEPEHLLLGIIDNGEGVGATVLTNLGISLDDMKRVIRETITAPGDVREDGSLGSGVDNKETPLVMPPASPRELVGKTIMVCLRAGEKIHVHIAACIEGCARDMATGELNVLIAMNHDPRRSIDGCGLKLVEGASKVTLLDEYGRDVEGVNETYTLLFLG
jgi:ATP-dependent Clp protease ATP-binding subunit ClpA